MENVVNKTHGIKLKDQFGYALGICAFALGFGYNLSKKKLAEMHVQLSEYRQSVKNNINLKKRVKFQ